MNDVDVLCHYVRRHLDQMLYSSYTRRIQHAFAIRKTKDV